ncbi:MAG: mannose-1-phosphate guanylyltransferase [Candidatus Hydrogenedentes bacterium]|nr:mannose-1-phosphate guanylyltransferase [Candidatus Hydrogenedentota bacterium]
MAGGAGERFWPVSRRLHPKQLLRLTSPTETMLHESVNRLRPLVAPEHIYVQTSEELVDAIRAANVGIPDENVIAEPCRRNTAGCLCYAAARMLARYGGDGDNLTMAVVTADHRIGDNDAFTATLAKILDVVEAEPALGTIGIPPTRPATGFGYVHAVRETGLAADTGVPQAHAVAGFREKPPLEVAEEYVATGDYFWNSGMFFWRIGVFVREFEAANPAFAFAIREMRDAMRAGDGAAVRRVFEGLKSESIDYALMEKAKKVVMVNATFPWDDIGAWSALERSRTPDARGNVSQGAPVLIDCDGCIVYNDEGAEARSVAVVGMADVVVVATKDAVLVVPKDRTEDVKKAVQALQERNAPHV